MPPETHPDGPLSVIVSLEVRAREIQNFEPAALGRARILPKDRRDRCEYEAVRGFVTVKVAAIRAGPKHRRHERNFSRQLTARHVPENDR